VRKADPAPDERDVQRRLTQLVGGTVGNSERSAFFTIDQLIWIETFGR
jgi:hypothetical protein